MLTIRDPTDADRIGDPSIRSLVRRRLAEVLDGEPYDLDCHGEFLVVEPGVCYEAYFLFSDGGSGVAVISRYCQINRPDLTIPG